MYRSAVQRLVQAMSFRVMRATRVVFISPTLLARSSKATASESELRLLRHLVQLQGVGIRTNTGVTNTRIGGTTAGSANIIARNGTGGGVMLTANSNGTTIQGNVIYGNNGLAIDLGGDGATTNDGALTAGQPNQRMDTPVLSNANLVGNNLTLAGYVGSAAGQSTFANSRVEFYKTTANSSVFLGSLTTDGSGNFSGTLDVTGLGLSQSDPIIATATDPTGNTSEFSLSFEANAARQRLPMPTRPSKLVVHSTRPRERIHRVMCCPTIRSEHDRHQDRQRHSSRHSGISRRRRGFVGNWYLWSDSDRCQWFVHIYSRQQQRSRTGSTN